MKIHDIKNCFDLINKMLIGFLIDIVSAKVKNMFLFITELDMLSKKKVILHMLFLPYMQKSR